MDSEVIKDLLTNVTPGPWAWDESHPLNACASVTTKSDAGWTIDIATLYGTSDNVPAPTMPDEPWGDHPIRRANARFIAAARELVPALLAERDAALEPDQTALALVAAAYRDAADVLDDPGDNAATAALGHQLCCNGHHCGCQGSDVGEYLQHIIKQQTPADATAALAAIERAAYERGVREAADAVPVELYHESWMARMLVCARIRILALLTQEGR